MTSLISMYVFFDVNGDIKAITPSLDESLTKEFTSSVFSLTEVEPFLTGKRNISDYRIRGTKLSGGTRYRLEKKYSTIVYTRTLDNYLTKIDSKKDDNTIVSVANNVSQRTLTLRLSADFRDGFTIDTDNDDVQEFINTTKSTIYITEKNNPYKLFYSINFSPRTLFEKGVIYFKYDEPFGTDTSAYTKKIISGYSYEEKNNGI